MKFGALSPLVALGLAAVAAPAQERAAEEAALARRAVEALQRFARLAEGNRIGTAARKAYELALEYDPEQRAVRGALGYQRIGGEWRLSRRPPQWVDNGDETQRTRVAAAWAETQKELGALHRELGIGLLARGDREHGKAQLQRALAYDPMDAAAHQALGHQERAGFYGSAEEIAFLDRLAAIEATARALAAKAFATKALPPDQVPPELQRSGLEFHGARSEHFCIWTRGDDAAAARCAEWAERALALLAFLLGEQRAAQLQVPQRLGYKWIAFTWSAAERDQVLERNPEVWRGQDWNLVRRFDDFIWPERGQQSVVIWTTPETIHDRVVGFVWFQGFLFGRNEGLGEGLLHVGTSLLLGSVHTWYGALPSTRAAGDKLAKPSTGAWLAQLRALLARGDDQPIEQVAREPRTHYRPQVRIKAWYWMLWLLARHPDRWFEFFQQLSAPKQLLPETVDAIGQQVFGRPLAELEQEWRDWAAGTSPLARASGHGVDK